jgi:NADH:ubiquinone oxidoreductase subunit E
MNLTRKRSRLERLTQLAEKVKASCQDGHLPCAKAHQIAQDADVPKIAVGEVADRLGIRIINCQIGCFKVEKIIHDNVDQKKNIDDGIKTRLQKQSENGYLTCADIFKLALQLKLTPMAIANVANSQSIRIHICQLGCF